MWRILRKRCGGDSNEEGVFYCGAMGKYYVAE